MMKKYWNKFLEDPMILIFVGLGLIQKLILNTKTNIEIQKGVILIGLSLMDIRNGGELRIKQNVLLRSRNRGYHAHMFSRTKLMVDPDGKLEIGENTKVYGACIHASKEIIIGKRCLIASNVQIMDRNGHDSLFSNPAGRINSYGEKGTITIHDDVWIGSNSIILPGTSIDKGSIVMGNSLVKGNFKGKCLIGGVPAKILKSF